MPSPSDPLPHSLQGSQAYEAESEARLDASVPPPSRRGWIDKHTSSYVKSEEGWWEGRGLPGDRGCLAGWAPLAMRATAFQGEGGGGFGVIEAVDTEAASVGNQIGYGKTRPGRSDGLVHGGVNLPTLGLNVEAGSCGRKSDDHSPETWFCFSIGSFWICVPAEPCWGCLDSLDSSLGPRRFLPRASCRCCG